MSHPIPRRARWDPAWVFLVTFAIYAYFMPRWADWNIDSRFDLVRAVVDHHTLSIDRYHWNTWDKAVYGGHYYSDKAPGTAALGALVYGSYRASRALGPVDEALATLAQNRAWLTAIQLGTSSTQKAPAPKGTTLGGCQRSGVRGNVQYIPWGNRLYPPFREWALSKYVTTIGAVALPSALFAVVFFWFLGLFGLGRLARWLGTLLYALGTVALPYSTVFYSHQIAAACLFTAFALLYRWQARRAAWMPPAAGFLLGFAFFTEYTVAIIIGLVGLYALWVLRRSPSGLASLCVAGVLPVAAVFAYNAAIFGGPLDTGYTHDFCWSAAQAAGFAGFTYPRPGPLFDLTFGEYRGLFFASPFLLLAVPGAWRLARERSRVETILCLSAGIVFILAISAYWGWNGGRVDGPRYLVPCVPFLAFPAAVAIDALLATIGGRLLVAALALWSVAVTWVFFLGGELFPISWLIYPLTDYSLPQLSGNHVAPNAGMFAGLRGWESLLPLSVWLLVVAAAVMASGRRRTVRSD